MAPESMNMAMPMSMPMMGPGGGMMGAPSPLSGAGPGGSMALRLGGMVPSSMGAMGIGMGMGMGMGHHAMPPTPSSASPIVKPMAEPLPEPPKPLDPRARQQQKSYQDLDGPAAEGDVELQY